jgi:hypothetical protein
MLLRICARARLDPVALVPRPPLPFPTHRLDSSPRIALSRPVMVTLTPVPRVGSCSTATASINSLSASAPSRSPASRPAAGCACQTRSARPRRHDRLVPASDPQRLSHRARGDRPPSRGCQHSVARQQFAVSKRLDVYGAIAVLNSTVTSTP